MGSTLGLGVMCSVDTKGVKGCGFVLVFLLVVGICKSPGVSGALYFDGFVVPGVFRIFRYIGWFKRRRPTARAPGIFQELLLLHPLLFSGFWDNSACNKAIRSFWSAQWQ